MKKPFRLLFLLFLCLSTQLFAQAPALVKDVQQDYGSAPYLPALRVGNKVFYHVNSSELWVTDASSNGTLLLKTFSVNPLIDMFELNGQLIFMGDGNNDGSSELWSSDGSVSGTTLVKDALPGPAYFLMALASPSGSKALCRVNDTELWVTDGTPTGTFFLRNFGTEHWSSLHGLNGRMLFFADDDNDNRYELWSSDGTVAGTVLVQNVPHVYNLQPFVPFLQVGNRYFYRVNFNQLWTSDGSAGGTFLLKTFGVVPMSSVGTFHELNGKLLFFTDEDNDARYELWTSDGTVAGTVLVLNIFHSYSFQEAVQYLKVGSQYFYRINEGQLWVTDGSTNGTVLLKDFPSRELNTFHELNGKLLCFADEDNDGSSELWTSDGTTGGTTMVQNLAHDYGLYQDVGTSVYADGKYYYRINGDELWVSDGSTGGTSLLKTFGTTVLNTFHVLDGQFLFAADDDNDGHSELWTSDGSVAGTVMLKDLAHNYSQYMHIPYLAGGSHVFYDVNFGELWMTDGTASGTLQLKAFSSNFLEQFHTLGSDFLFFADDDNDGRSELWSVQNGVVSVHAPNTPDTELEVWPVPARSQLSVRVEGAAFQSAALSVVDVQGRVLVATELKGGLAQLDLEGIAPGLYILHLQNAKGSRLSRKVVVE